MWQSGFWAEIKIKFWAEEFFCGCFTEEAKNRNVASVNISQDASICLLRAGTSQGLSSKARALNWSFWNYSELNKRRNKESSIKLFTVGSGGGVGVGCSPIELKVIGSILGVDWNFSVFKSNFPIQLCATPALNVVGLFLSHLFPLFFLYLSFPVQFASLTLKFFRPFSSFLNSYARCTKLANGIRSLSLLGPSFQDETVEAEKNPLPLAAKKEISTWA